MPSDFMAAPIRAAIAAALAAGSLHVAAQTAAPEIVTDPATGERHVARRLLVQGRAGLPDRALDRILGEHGGGRRVARLRESGLHVIELPAGVDERALARRLARHAGVKSAEVDRVVAHAFAPNDPSLASQWHHAHLGSAAAWDVAAGDAVVVAIADTGVDATHPDLAGVIVPGWNAYDNNSDTRDVYGHGTAVAGTAAAIGNNAQGVAGMAWRARIMPIRISDTTGYATWSAMAQAITWAANNGARVVNLSYQNSCGSSAIASAAQYLRSRGGVVVIAAGNTGAQIADAANDAVVCVSATDSADARTSWSSYGAAVDVAAPGADILTTMRGGGYGGWNGTSFAAPLVAGTYALMMAANWSLAPSTLDAILFATARDLGTAGADPYFGRGRIDTAAAVARAASTIAVDTTAPTVSITSPGTNARVRGVVPVDVSAADASGIARVELAVNGAPFATDTASPYGFAIDTSAYVEGTALQLVARAVDAAGNAASTGVTTIVVSNDAEAPRVSFASPGDGAAVSGTVQVVVDGADNVGVAQISLAIDGRQVAQASGGRLSYSWAVPAVRGRKTVTSQTSILVATAIDAAGNQTSKSISVVRTR